MKSDRKIFKTREAVARFCQEARRQGKVIVFTNGVFDMLHPGHLETLRFAASEGDVVVVGVNTDESVQRLKGKGRPILPLDHRLRMLAALEPVNAVVAFSEDTPAALIEAVNPHFLLKGGDYVPEEIVGYDHVVRNGGKVLTVPLVEGRSTTNVVSEIKRRFLKSA